MKIISEGTVTLEQLRDPQFVFLNMLRGGISRPTDLVWFYEPNGIVAELQDALSQAEACLSIVEPRSDKAEYLRVLGVVRKALERRP